MQAWQKVYYVIVIMISFHKCSPQYVAIALLQNIWIDKQLLC